MGLQRVSSFTLPSTRVRSCLGCPSVLTSSLSVIHVVHRVAVDFPCKVNRDETKNQPAEQDFEYGDPHVVGKPIVHKLGEERQAAVGDAGQKLKIPRLLHTVRLMPNERVSGSFCQSEDIALVKQDVLSVRPNC